MKSIMFMVCIVSITLPIFAGPFGLEMGMKLEQINEVSEGEEPQNIEDDRYFIIPKMKHPSFESYVVFVNEKLGLYYIKALSYAIRTNKYGTELKNAFEDIEYRISKIYGKSITVDEIHPESIWKSEDEWMYALKQGDRKLYSYWMISDENKLPDNLDVVGITVMADMANRGYILLEYQFENFEDVKEIEDSVF